MRYFIILLIIVALSCKAQKDKYLISKEDGYTLPADQLEKSEENSRLKSVQHSISSNDFQKVIFENKEYSTKEFLNISHTLDSSYTFDIKIDSLTKGKILVVKKKKE